MHLLITQAETVRALSVGAHQAPGGVVDSARQCLAFIGGAVQVEVERQRTVFINRLIKNCAKIMLVPGVFVARAVEAGTEVFAWGVNHTGEVECIAFGAVGVIHHKALVMAAGIAIGALGEMPADQFQVFEFIAGEENPGSGFGKQAAVG